MKIIAVKVFNEGTLWKWKIKDDNGNIYVDNDNYQTREAAEEVLKQVLENDLWKNLSKNCNLS